MKRAIFGLFLLAFFLFLGACDISYGGGEHDDRRPLQTRILEVLIEPHPIRTGETVVLTAVIEDSLDTRFEYTWIADQFFEVTLFNQLEWTVDLDPGQYSITVKADNGDQSKERARYTVSVEVIP